MAVKPRAWMFREFVFSVWIVAVANRPIDQGLQISFFNRGFESSLGLSSSNLPGVLQIPALEGVGVINTIFLFIRFISIRLSFIVGRRVQRTFIVCCTVVGK